MISLRFPLRCKGVKDCPKKCTQSMAASVGQKIKAMMDCGKTTGCLKVPGGAVGAPKKCGDGVCDGPETTSNCPADCKSG